MKKVVSVLFIFLLVFMCSCSKTGETASTVPESANKDNSSVSDVSDCIAYEPRTEEEITQEATHVMFAHCADVCNSEAGKAVFRFAVIKEFKAEMNSEELVGIKVVGDLDNYDYKHTYAADNSYLLWLIYDEENDVYTDIGLHITPLREREPLGSVDAFEAYRQEIIDLNPHFSGQVFDWMYNPEAGNGSLS